MLPGPRTKNVKSKSAARRPPLTYAIDKGVFILQKEKACMQRSATYKNGEDDRQRHTGLLIGNQGNSLEKLGNMKFHWWMLGGHRWSVVSIPMSWTFNRRTSWGCPAQMVYSEIRYFPIF